MANQALDPMNSIQQIDPKLRHAPDLGAFMEETEETEKIGILDLFSFCFLFSFCLLFSFCFLFSFSLMLCSFLYCFCFFLFVLLCSLVLFLLCFLFSHAPDLGAFTEEAEEQTESFSFCSFFLFADVPLFL